MKQILQNARSGDLEIVEVPAPMPLPGQVLVRNHYSVMSPGTDRLSLAFARSSLISKARSRPDLVRQVLGKWKVDGALATYRTVTSRLETPQPLGYSSAGVVEAVGIGVNEFAPGDRVSCAGAGYANHAELVCVPENLVAPVPAEVSLQHAAYATLGAIALQSVRVGDPTLGEIVAVVGLGLVGQLGVQLLRANGCRVLGLDLNDLRAKQALDQGAEWAATPGSLPATWKEDATGGHGVDLALVAASASSSAPLQLAADLCRHKGRLAVVGAMPLEIERRAMYDKELDLRMSMSYGPGRYDRSYEELGNDYPLPYVRWTENRNLRAFLALIDSGSLHLDRLDTTLAPFDEAVGAYNDLVSGRSDTLAVAFQYDAEVSPDRTLPLPTGKRAPTDALGVSFIGAGNYAKALLLPMLDRRDDIHRLTLVTATGASARRTAEKFGFSGCGTNPEAVFKDPNVGLVFIATRHDTHVPLALRALDEEKAVWLEKPVALSPEDLDVVAREVRERDAFLAVGYNRRFSPHARKIRSFFEDRSGPLSIHYSVAAGPPPRDSWSMDPIEGGGRVIGESCHFIDLVNYLIGAPCSSVFARFVTHDVDLDDSMISVLSYPDGSTCLLEYLAHADPRLPKERFEVSAEGKTARCSNFRMTELSGQRNFRTLSQDKGQSTAVNEVVDAVQRGAASPFTLDEIVNVSRVTFAMLESAAAGAPVSVEALSAAVEHAAPGGPPTTPGDEKPIKVVLVHRVLPHWRTPVFRRLASRPGIDFVALHGSDFPGTKTVNGRDLSGFTHREMWTLRLVSRVTNAREITFPLWPTLPWHLLRERPDVILAEGGSNLPMVCVLILCALLMRVPVVWWSLGEIPHPGPLSRSQRIFRAVVRFLERRCSVWLGYSSLAGDYFRRCGYPPERCFVAVNCVDTDAVRERLEAARAAAAPLREQLGIADKRVLLFVGALAPYKRVEDLIAVYARLRVRHPDLRLLVVGGGPHRTVLEQHARDLGADDAIFTGEVVEGVGPYFELGDVLVLPGLGGLAISEAMTHGLPIVATLADGCEVDLVEEGRSGHIVRPGDLERLEACLEDMLEDPQRLQSMGQAGRRIIDERHNIGSYMDNLVAALRCGAGRANAGPTARAQS